MFLSFWYQILTDLLVSGSVTSQCSFLLCYVCLCTIVTFEGKVVMIPIASFPISTSHYGYKSYSIFEGTVSVCRDSSVAVITVPQAVRGMCPTLRTLWNRNLLVKLELTCIKQELNSDFTKELFSDYCKFRYFNVMPKLSPQPIWIPPPRTSHKVGRMPPNAQGVVIAAAALAMLTLTL